MQNSMKHRRQRAFTLLELAIILAILGLLVGGIMAGLSLVRGSELRSILSERSRIATALSEFKNKYGGFPGDIRDATKYWNAADPDPVTCQTTIGVGIRTCDGDGSGTIAGWVGNPATFPVYESFRAWQQLANAGLIDGNYTGVVGGAGTYDSVFGSNVPASKIDGAGYNIQYASCIGFAGCAPWSGDALGAASPDPLNGHMMLYGGYMAGHYPRAAFLKPEELWNLDTKIDDGKPGYGIVRTYKDSFMDNCVTTSAHNTAAYELTYTTAASCALIMGLGM